MDEPAHIEIMLIEGPIPPDTAGPIDAQQAANCGAVLVFLGVVRTHEPDGPIDALAYEIYEPMTSRELRRVAVEAAASAGVKWMRIEHSFGPVAPGRISFRLTIASAHRGPAIHAADAFIERMKAHVPIWKVPIRNDAPNTPAKTDTPASADRTTSP